MAIYHLDVKMISRSNGRSAIAAAAYRAAEEIEHEVTGEVFDYRRKQGVEFAAIYAPEGSPSWVTDRARLWNEVEKSERRKNSQVARDLLVALPVELNSQQQEALIAGFVKSEFVRLGMIADVTIHRDNPDNPHAHVLLTTREIGADGFTKKNRDWNRKEYLLDWREQWAVQSNMALDHAGVDVRVDHRSYVEQKIDLVPTTKMGVQNKNGVETREFMLARMEQRAAVCRENGTRT